jgi:peptide deformylase
MTAQPRTPTRILRYGQPCLRRTCEAVDPAAPATRRLADRLWRALERGGGVGLAAPQIGRASRVCVVREHEGPRSRRLVLVNPEIVARSDREVEFEEGCLSFPGLFTMIRRPRAVQVEYDDLAGRRNRLEDDGLLARVAQHEIDHLDGILFIDRLPVWRRWTLRPRLWWLARGSGRSRA